MAWMDRQVRYRTSIGGQFVNIEIRNVNGHYEAYVDGKFAGSGDTYGEALKEAEEVT